jgi:iron complex transport system ATP-binding protein
VKLVVKGLVVEVPGKRLVDNAYLEVGAGEVLGVFGPNGAGKTSLLKAIAGIVKGSGAVYVSGTDLSRLRGRERAKLVTYLPPHVGGEGFSITVLDLVAMAGYPRGVWDEASAWTVLRRLGIEHLAYRRLDTLSAGELQMVLIAHALARRAEVVLVDEPTAFLDLANRVRVLSALRELAREQGSAVVIATHDLILAYRYVDKVVLMKHGRIYAAGPKEAVLTPESIREVYGVDVKVAKVGGELLILPA